MARENITERQAEVKAHIDAGTYNQQVAYDLAIKHGCNTHMIKIDVVYLMKGNYPINPSLSVRKRIFRRDKKTCQYCLSKDKQLIIEHVVPYFQGGHGLEYNLVTSCSECNYKKSKKVWIPKNYRVLKKLNPSWFEWLYSKRDLAQSAPWIPKKLTYSFNN